MTRAILGLTMRGKVSVTVIRIGRISPRREFNPDHIKRMIDYMDSYGVTETLLTPDFDYPLSFGVSGDQVAKIAEQLSIPYREVYTDD